MTRILIVDDKDENLAYLEALLEGDGCIVESARHGAEALVKARQTPPDLIISDLLMPVMDGYTLLRHWKADARLKPIPFIVYTATYTDPEDERLALNLGADAFILKPSEPEHLIARLREVRANAASAHPAPPRVAAADEGAQLKLYSETLIRKLEEKTLQLEVANHALRLDIAEREKAEMAQRRMAETQVAILNALPAHIALVDAQGVIVSVNEAWRRFASANVLQGPDFCVGHDYLAVCERATGDCSEEAKAAAAGIRRVLQCETTEFAIEYPCHSPAEQRWFRLMVTPLSEEHRIGAVIMHVNITARRLSENAVRESEQRLELATKSAHIGIWDWRVAENEMIWDQQMFAIYGIGESEFSGAYDAWQKGLHPEDRERAEAEIKVALAGACDFHSEFRVRWPDGQVRHIEAHGIVQRTEDGSPTRMIGVNWDITERKRAEEALCNSEERLRLITDLVPHQIFVKDAAGRYIFANSAKAEYYGVTMAEMIGKTDFDLERNQSQAEAYRVDDLSVIQSGNKKFIPEEIGTDLLGRTAFFQTTKVPFTVAETGEQAVLGVAIDITHRKQAEQALRESEQRFSNAFEYAPIGVALVSPDGHWLKANRALCDIVGYSEVELCSRTLSDITHTGDLGATFDNFHRALAGELQSYEMEKRYIHARGHVVPIFLNVSLLRDDQRRPRYFIVQIQDFTERKKTEANLEKTHRELIAASRLAGMAEVATGILHNVGNVLNSVNVSSTFIAESIRKSKSADVARVAALLRDHQANLGEFMTNDPRGKHLAGYIEQLAIHLKDEQLVVIGELDELQKNIEHIKAIVAKQQGLAKLSGMKESLKVADVVEDALKINADSLDRHGIQVVKEIAETPLIPVDKHMLLQILVNLIRNAKDAFASSPKEGRTLILRVSTLPNAVRMEVGDNGVGIAPENLTRIFAHGFTTKKEGHGFGLHSSILAAGEMGGTLTVHSEGIGRGATFAVELPVDSN